MEPILTEPHNKYVMDKVNYPDLQELYVKAYSSFWTPDELSLSSDILDWNNKLTDAERQFIKQILSFFSSSDFIVQENIAMRFMQEVKINEARAFYSIQIAIEQIHQDTYSSILKTYITDKHELETCFDAVLNDTTIKRKADWASKWMSSNIDFATRLVAFAIVEGVYFSSSFAAIYWLKSRKLLPTLCGFNEFIARDEALHCEFAIALFKYLNNKPKSIEQIMREAVDVECAFVTDSLPVSLLGMNNHDMCTYVKYCADRIMIQLGYNKLYNTVNPFTFMEQISLSNKTNFFENRATEYASPVYGDPSDIDF